MDRYHGRCQENVAPDQAQKSRSEQSQIPVERSPYSLRVGNLLHDLSDIGDTVLLKSKLPPSRETRLVSLESREKRDESRLKRDVSRFS